MDNDLESEVVELISQATNINPDRITRKSTFRSLGIDGDDAVEILDELIAKYSIDVHGVDFRQYTGPEASYGLLSLLFNAFRSKPNYAIDHDRLTVDLLIRSAAKGYWDDKGE